MVPSRLEVDADVIVTIGGGSLTDGAKVVRIALQTNTENAEELGQYCFKGDVTWLFLARAVFDLMPGSLGMLLLLCFVFV